MNCGTGLPTLLGDRSRYASMCCCVMMASSMEPSRSMADEELEKFRGDDKNDRDDSGLENPDMGGVFGTEDSATKSLVDPTTGDDDADEGGTGENETSLCAMNPILVKERPRGIMLPVSNSSSISFSVTRAQLPMSRDWLAAAESV